MDDGKLVQIHQTDVAAHLIEKAIKLGYEKDLLCSYVLASSAEGILKDFVLEIGEETTYSKLKQRLIDKYGLAKRNSRRTFPTNFLPKKELENFFIKKMSPRSFTSSMKCSAVL